jgi:hypothetical protein
MLQPQCNGPERAGANINGGNRSQNEFRTAPISLLQPARGGHFFVTGKPAFLQADMPPMTFRTSLNPSRCKNEAAILAR